MNNNTRKFFTLFLVLFTSSTSSYADSSIITGAVAGGLFAGGLACGVWLGITIAHLDSSFGATQEIIYTDVQDFTHITTSPGIEIDAVTGTENNVKISSLKKNTCAALLKPLIANNELILQYQDAQQLEKCKGTKVEVASKNSLVSLKHVGG